MHDTGQIAENEMKADHHMGHQKYREESIYNTVPKLVQNGVGI